MLDGVKTAWDPRFLELKDSQVETTVREQLRGFLNMLMGGVNA